MIPDLDAFVKNFTIEELANYGRQYLLTLDPKTHEMLLKLKGADGEKYKHSVLYLGGPNHGWYLTGQEADQALWLFRFFELGEKAVRQAHPCRPAILHRCDPPGLVRQTEGVGAVRAEDGSGCLPA